MIKRYIHYYNTKRVQRNLGVLTPMEKHELWVNPKFCVNSIWGANRAKFIKGGGAVYLALGIRSRRCYSGIRPAKNTAIWAWIRLQSCRRPVHFS